MKRHDHGKSLQRNACVRWGRQKLAVLLCINLLLSLWSDFPVGENVFAAEDSALCPHHTEHNEVCGYKEAAEGRACGHVHDKTCGYGKVSAGNACGHIHDGTCGYEEASEGSPCGFQCRQCITGWQWDDEDQLLSWDEHTGLWYLGLPGVDETRPLSREMIAELLPRTVTVDTAAGSGTAELTWDLSEFPEDGAYTGSFCLTAALPQEYILTEGVPALQVLLELGGGELYESAKGHRPGPVTQVPANGDGRTHKFVSKWSYVVPDGGAEIRNNGSETDFEYSTTMAFHLAAYADNAQGLIDAITAALPKQIYGEGSNFNSQLVNAGFIPETASPPTDWSIIKGFVNITWNVEEAVSNMSVVDGKAILQLYADPVSNAGYLLRVNTNDDTYKDSGNDEADTAEAYDVINLTVTLRNINPADHVVAPANPENLTVNLFDYWVEDYGENPAKDQGDILQKSDWHIRPNADSQGNLTTGETNTAYSTVQDWNKGINQSHLLLFGDGLIHAGLWNKGAGESTIYGNTYAGMEGIVKKVLYNGYPEINLPAAGNQLTEGPAYRDYQLVRDYQLAGTQESVLGTSFNGNAYEGTDIQNLSKDVLQTWGGDPEKDTESLQYLFDPHLQNDYKTSYTDVTGLFQLDENGYYYYNMRENFAEFSQEGGNHFILYDAPATVRTDGTGSIGNFFPFNKASEVFNGISEEGKLTSSVACSRNSMNHHLGMTVSVDFRQPAGGKINTGNGGQQPMTFGFSGDDDVWIFVDDVLVLDLGGIHSEIYGTIDFSTGDVYIGRAFGVNGVPEKPDAADILVTHTTLKKAYQEAGLEDTTQWNDNTFASGTSHTLKMFYLERGNYDSSIALRFNLQPLLYQQIKKVDQNGDPVQGVSFDLFPAEVTADTGGIRCFYTDNSVTGSEHFYVKQTEGSSSLVTVTTDEDGYAQFRQPDANFFNFADRGDAYYILREINAPPGYRRQPVDIVLRYDSATAMLSVANRWTTGAYASSVSNITGTTGLKYGVFADNGITAGSVPVSEDVQERGLAVAVPLLQKKSNNSWLALYGSNLSGFGSVPIKGDTESAWLNAVLQAALEQAKDGETSDWHLSWDEGNRRLYGMLRDLPGLASRYKLNNRDGDMQMVYGIISAQVLTALGITGADADTRYEELRQKVADENGMKYVLETILGTEDGFRFLSVAQFNRDFRSLIYIPNERRELRVLKIDGDGRPLENAEFTLYEDEACTRKAASGFTGADGMLIFSPTKTDGASGEARMMWANSANTQYYLRETQAPDGHKLNDTITPVVVGIYGIYADAGTADNGVSVIADVGRLTQTMRQYAMGGDVDVTLQDITAFMQTQASGNFSLTGWEDAKLDGTDIVRSMNLHFEKNHFVDYGLHDEDGGKNYYPFFITATGYIRARVEQNYTALTTDQYGSINADADKENLGDTDLTNMFSLLNMVAVSDPEENPVRATGTLTISKRLTGSGLSHEDYTRGFAFKVELTAADGSPLDGSYDYYFYGENKAGTVSAGDTLILHHDEALTILGLPAGAGFTVTEMPEEGWYGIPETGKYSGEIVQDENFTAEFVNRREEMRHTGHLTVSKTVTGSAGDRNREFDFTVTLEGQGNFTHDGVEYTLPQTLTFFLKDGESVTLRELPEGTKYSVTENGNLEYRVEKTGDAGVINKEETSQARFINHLDQTDPNVEYTSVTVKKVWLSEDGGTLPEHITAVLYRDGLRYSSAQLNAGNGWAYTWEHLEAGHTWTVEEPEVPAGFTSSVSRDEEMNFIITNKAISEDPSNPGGPNDPEDPSNPEGPGGPEDPSNPGDSNNPENPGEEAGSNSGSDDLSRRDIPQTGMDWGPVLLITAIGILLILAGVREKLYNDHKD